MTYSKFSIWLVGITIGMILISWALLYVPGFEQSKSIATVSIPFFVVLSVLIYILALRASKSKNPNTLTQLVMIMVFVKLISCIALVMIHNQFYPPTSRFYIVPFLLSYVVYTIFEVVILTSANNQSVT